MTETGTGRGTWVHQALREHEEHAGRARQHRAGQHRQPGRLRP